MTVTKILEATLTAGQTSVIFNDADIPNSLIRIYSNDTSLLYTSATLSGTSLTVTYEAQTSNKNIALELVKAGMDIVDNVTSTDADKALSAKQGKELKDSIDTLTNTVNNLDIPDNITDLDDVVISSIQDGQVLAWDDNTDKFVNVTPSSRVIYSTTEQVIGTWIDDKTLYEKTVTPNTTAINNHTYIDSDFANADMMQVISGYYVVTDSYLKIPLNQWESSTYYTRCGCRNDNSLYLFVNGYSITGSAVITIRYTKTTD